MRRNWLLACGLVALLAACTMLSGIDDLTIGANEGTMPPDVHSGEGSVPGPDGDVDAPPPIPEAGGDALPLGCGAADAGLVAYFLLDEGEGLTIKDCSGNGLTGTMESVGGGWGPGIRDAGLLLDASYVDLGQPAALKRTGAITVAAWVNRAPMADSERPAIVSKMGNTNQRGWELAVRNEAQGRATVFRVSPDGADELEVMGGTITTGQWVHVAGVFEPGLEVRVYVNGVRTATTPVTITTMHDPDVPARIGARSYEYYWRGGIDEVRVYDRPLSDDEIAALAAMR